jgi:hypothetical protein
MRWSAPRVHGAVPRPRCQAACAASRDGELLLLFGGACHSEPEPLQEYGDMVVDLDDLHLLHVPTRSWFAPPPHHGGCPDLCEPLEQRGGTNALAWAGDRLLCFGGMHSDQGDPHPHFVHRVSLFVGFE